MKFIATLLSAAKKAQGGCLDALVGPGGEG